jgi:hypothetical protein
MPPAEEREFITLWNAGTESAAITITATPRS